MTPTPSELAAQIMDLCRGMGFDLAGVCEAAPSARVESLRAWLAEGLHGEMEFMARDAALREDPRRFSVMVRPGDARRRGEGDAGVLPVRSFIVVGMMYSTRGHRDTPVRGSGRIARYARGRDYHREARRRLHALSDALRARFPAEGFLTFVDTVPIMERELAELAGLGWVGKHTLLIHPRLGSYFALGGVGTSLPLAPPPGQARVSDHCGTCTRCIDACPTGAISPYRVDARRCISYLTIEHRSPIQPHLHPPMGDWLAGCDVCQEVCPHNSARGEPHAREGGESGAADRASLRLLDVLGWSPADRVRALQGSALKRLTLAMLKRNAIVVGGNLIARGEAEPAMIARVREIAQDLGEPDMVRETAREALARRAARE